MVLSAGHTVAFTREEAPKWRFCQHLNLNTPKPKFISFPPTPSSRCAYLSGTPLSKHSPLEWPFLNLPQATYSGPVLCNNWTAILLSELPLSSSSLVEALMISNPDFWCHLPPPLVPYASHATHITGPIFLFLPPTKKVIHNKLFCLKFLPHPRKPKWLSSLLIKISTNDFSSPTSISLHDKASLCHQSGLPLWLRWWRIRLQCTRRGFDPWVGKIPWIREQLSTPVFWPGEFYGQRSLVGHSHGLTKSQTQLSDLHFHFHAI